ncbi:MAG: hypothetical protein KGV51_01205 [Moraxellaceae bacterium]|nr:hypothetical protein [Moraxellaceae bacterium]
MNSDVGLLICLLTLILAIFSLYWRLKYYIFHVKKQNIKDIYELRQKLPTLDNEPKFIQDMELGTIDIFQGLTLEQVEFLMHKNLSLQLMTNISLLMKHDLCRLENNVLIIPKPAYIYRKYLLNLKNISALVCILFFITFCIEVIFSQNFSIIEYFCLLSLTLVMEFYLLLSLKGMIIYNHIIKMKQVVSDIDLRVENNFDGGLKSKKTSDSTKKSWFKQKLADLKQWKKEQQKTKEQKEKAKEPTKKVWKKEKPTVVTTQSAKNKAMVNADKNVTNQQKTIVTDEDKNKTVSIEDYLLNNYEIEKEVEEDLQKIKLEEYQTALKQAQPMAYEAEQAVSYEYESDLKYQNSPQQPVAYERETEYQYQEDIQQEQPVTYERETEYQYQEEVQQEQPVAYESETEYQYQEEISQEQPVAYETETEYQYQADVQQEQPVTYESETEYQYQEEVQQEQPVAYETETEYQYQEEVQQEQPVAYDSETEYQYQADVQQEQPVTYETETEYQYQEQPVAYEEHELKYQADVQQAQAETSAKKVDDKDNFNLPF